MGGFKPVGSRARWRELYDYAITLTPGEIITYKDFIDIIGYDPSIQGTSRSPIYRANKELLTTKSKTLISVPGEGYRIAHASEHETLARTHQTGAKRKMNSAITVAVHVDRNQLTESQQKSLDGLADLLMAQNAMLSRHDKRIGTVENRVDTVDERVEVLEQTLKAHGINIPERRTVNGETV